MSNGYRNGAFAVGLVSGVGLTFIFVLWLEHRIKQSGNHSHKGQTDSDYRQIGQLWDNLIGYLISPSGDTLAQWIMAAFTILAFVVLMLTLNSANKNNVAAVKASQAALEANQIMREEQRPWLSCDIVEDGQFYVLEGQPLAGMDVRMTFENHGLTPIVWAGTIFFLETRSDIRRTLVEMRTGKGFAGGGHVLEPLFPNKTKEVSKKIFPRISHKDRDGTLAGKRFVLFASTKYQSATGHTYFCEKSYFVDFKESDIVRTANKSGVKAQLIDAWAHQTFEKWMNC